VPISEAALALLGDVLGGRLLDALDAPETPATHELATLATSSLEHHVERRLKAAAVFGPA
jgi:DNA repair protein RecO (recombination protein O)